ncbi:hypothetical protein BpHYR1_026360 [Brachionus plicatilis]|uniref:Uncharacterized protein n=1 Tax=Brachionus plicatilis TaxID=10195 RepID=A0A3M7S155_BRAPC|nr:hypothetical protein BpHYR1_026360 [Brachionus plicatilis]
MNQLKFFVKIAKNLKYHLKHLKIVLLNLKRVYFEIFYLKIIQFRRIESIELHQLLSVNATCCNI